MPYQQELPVGYVDADEVKTERVLTAKKFSSAGTSVLRSHIARIHYWDQFDLDGTGQRYREIDTTLVALGGAQGWAMADKYGDYFCSVPRRSNEFSTFKNFEPANRGTDEAEYDEIGIRVPVPNPQAVVGVKTDALTVTYPGAFNRGGVDMDLVVGCYNDAVHHEVVIPSQPTGIAAEMPLVFELDVPAGLDFEINNIDWVDRTGTERTTQAIKVGKTGTPKSEWIKLRRFKVWDADGRRVPVDVTFEETSPGVVTMTKLIPRSFLLSATYPVTADAVLSPFSDLGGDGEVRNSGATWASVRGGATGTSTPSATTGRIQSFDDGAGSFFISRAHFPFDISAIGSGNTISNIDVNLRWANKIANDNDGDDYVTLYESTMSDPTSLVDADFDNYGSEIIDAGQRLDISATATGYNAHTLNAAGIAIADVTGWLKVMGREGHDAIDSAVTANNNVTIRMADFGGTGSDPYADVTYAATGGATFLPRIMIY